MRSKKIKYIIRNPQSAIRNEKGFALLMVLLIAVIVLAVSAALIYMITSGTQLSGIEKRYMTRLETLLSGPDIIPPLIARRGEQTDTAALLADITEITPAITTPLTCTVNTITLPSGRDCIDIDTYGGTYAGFATKLNLPTACWTGCDKSLTIDSGNSTTYDMSFVLSGYNIYGKIVDTVYGNTASASDTLWKTGVVVNATGDVSVSKTPYLYTIELEAQAIANPLERTKLSILYQY